ncbi:MAG: hypothetical protein JO023_25080 [Chloroflexi bacterium]|nr:hypothetical protein [Chloroflexota bacterium]
MRFTVERSPTGAWLTVFFTLRIKTESAVLNGFSTTGVLVAGAFVQWCLCRELV